MSAGALKRGAAVVGAVVALVAAAPTAFAEPDSSSSDAAAFDADVLEPDAADVDAAEAGAAEGAVRDVAASAAPAARPSSAPAVQPAAAAADATAAVDTGAVESSAPATTTTPDGWTMTISARDETQQAVAPLTTALSTREYAVGGVFNGALTGGEGAKGAFEVGYQIGCGINLNTVNLGVNGNFGPSFGIIGLDFPNIQADGILPGVAATAGGLVTVGLQAGEVTAVKVTAKKFKGNNPWVSVRNFRVKVDGCVGESFIRSYAVMVKSTDEGDAVLAWYGVTKKI